KYLYYKKDKTLNDIAIMKDVGEETVRRLMIKYGIDRKDKTRNFGGWNKGKEMSQEYKDNLSKIMKEKYQKGKIEHWNKGNHWDKDVREKISKSLLNGREPAPNYYGSDWQIQRTSCLQRDNYTCQQCGNKRNLEVHHWVPYRFSYNNRLCNLVTLCRDCHNFIHVMYKKEGFIYKNEEEFYGV
ncbi:MAG: HNH endonuclease, partial [Halanaerobiales bacterium]